MTSTSAIISSLAKQFNKKDNRSFNQLHSSNNSNLYNSANSNSTTTSNNNNNSNSSHLIVNNRLSGDDDVTVDDDDSLMQSNDGVGGAGVVSESGAWFEQLCRILATSVVVANIIAQGRCVVLHCSDGWDRTPQVIVLARLLLNASARTVKGFCHLLRHVWLRYGHKSQSRLGIGARVHREASPVFIQMLEAVYNIIQQQPHEFEFTPKLLAIILHCATSMRFASFFCDDERARLALFHRDVNQRTRAACLWRFILNGDAYREFGSFMNPTYVAHVDDDSQTSIQQHILPFDATPTRITIWWNFHRRNQHSNDDSMEQPPPQSKETVTSNDDDECDDDDVIVETILDDVENLMISSTASVRTMLNSDFTSSKEKRSGGSRTTSTTNVVTSNNNGNDDDDETVGSIRKNNTTDNKNNTNNNDDDNADDKRANDNDNKECNDEWRWTDVPLGFDSENYFYRHIRAMKQK